MQAESKLLTRQTFLANKLAQNKNMRTPRVTAVQIVRVPRWKGGGGEAEVAKKRCRKLPFPRGDVMQKFDRRRELASLYVPTIPLIRLIRGETEKRASRYTVCIRLHPVCIMQERKKEASIHRRATESDFIPAYYFLYSMRIHRVSFLCLYFLSTMFC